MRDKPATPSGFLCGHSVSSWEHCSGSLWTLKEAEATGVDLETSQPTPLLVCSFPVCGAGPQHTATVAEAKHLSLP